jgi:uncharacterized protein with HEPN domain
MPATRNPLVRLHHIKDEIDSITAALGGIDRNEFVNDYILNRAGERALQIIAEAARSLPDDLLRGYPEIDWPALRALGNVLRHEYHAVDADTLWEILRGKVAELAPIIDRMIQDLSN